MSPDGIALSEPAYWMCLVRVETWQLVALLATLGLLVVVFSAGVALLAIKLDRIAVSILTHADATLLVGKTQANLAKIDAELNLAAFQEGRRVRAVQDLAGKEKP